jgi:uncharacterized membrane protein
MRVRLVRLVTTRPLLAWSFVLGLATVLFWPFATPLVERLLLGWSVGSAIFIAAVSYSLSRLPTDRLRKKAADLDEGAVTILVLSMLAALASFGGVIFELGVTKGNGHLSLTLLLMIGTIVCSWFFMQVVFAVHYAQVYYNDENQLTQPSLDFGGDTTPPDYWDFIYFSVAIGASSATSDTNLRSRTMRRIVAAHAVFSFFFNATVLALAINIAAGLLGGN